MTVLVTKPAVNIREELADLKDQTTYDTVKSAGALMDVELTNEAAVKSINQALTTTSNVEFNQVTAALVGNASTATTLETARDIALSGDVTGSASFNGGGNIDITATVVDNSHNHTISNVTDLQTALDAKAALSGATFTDDVSLDTRLLLADGTAASPAIGFTNDQDSGLYYAAGAVRVAFNGTQTFAFDDGVAYSDSLLPSATESYALGGVSNRWNTFYTKDGDFSGSVTLGSDSTDDITVNGVLTNGAQINDGVGDVKIGYRNIPIVSATTVGTTHVGKCLTASGTVTVPNSTMSAGDVVSIFNNSASGITLTLNPTLAYVNGADAASATLSAYGVATVLFIDSTTCVVTGNVS